MALILIPVRLFSCFTAPLIVLMCGTLDTSLMALLDARTVYIPTIYSLFLFLDLHETNVGMPIMIDPMACAFN